MSSSKELGDGAHSNDSKKTLKNFFYAIGSGYLLVAYVAILDFALLFHESHPVEEPEGQAQYEYQQADQPSVQVQPKQVQVQLQQLQVQLQQVQEQHNRCRYSLNSCRYSLSRCKY